MNRRTFLKSLFGKSDPRPEGKQPDMSRRGFIGSVIAAFGALVAWPWSKPAAAVTAAASKEALIAQALATEEGRVALAQSMMEPIRRALDYQSVARKLLMVQEMPEGALARYKRDVQSIVKKEAA
jgi:hypothetical protein